MSRGVAVAGAFAAGLVAGGALVLSLPVPGVPDGGGPSRRPSPVIEPARVTTLLAWTPGGLPSGYVGQVRDLRAVRAAVAVNSGVAWLDAWEDADGRTHRPRRGFRIPIEVASVHPATYARFLPPGDRERLTGAGTVLVGRTFADAHDVDAGSTLRFGGVTLHVDGVIDDELVGAHEVVVSDDMGPGLGITRPRYMLVAPRTGTAARVEGVLRRLVPPGIRVRVRAPGETPVFRHGDAVLAPVRVKEVFGEFAARQLDGGLLEPDPAWVKANIRTGRVPILGPIRCHRLVIPLIRAALEDLVRRGLGHLVDPADYGGCYFPRYIARNPASSISNHSWGIAIDVNVSQGLPGRQPTIDRRVVQAFEAQGFKWGGEFLIPDGTHFEFIRFP
ncbi:MAG TPA: M15 family metallopeptidase [Actinomycetota bacterium]|nr:M15 family metallopeptidase [Actinomycetota bacterium]